MTSPVEVRFKGNRKAYYHWKEDTPSLQLEQYVIVEAERGLDCGVVSAVGEVAALKCDAVCNGCARGAAPKVIHSVLRLASDDEMAIAVENRRSEEGIRQAIIDRVRTHKLDMKVSDAEWQWDHSTLTVYFTAENRVDFRSLVRDLATRFRTRIDLRQIGVRDEAARLGGIGRCGREYCCSTWLNDLSPVSLSLAKDQRLSLNPAQISGGCGRLLCCLKYEHEFYVASRKRFPKEGKRIPTGLGQERVVAVDIFRERVFLRHDELGTRIIPLVDLLAEQAGGPVATPLPPPTRTVPEPKPEVDPPGRPAKSRRTKGRRRRSTGKGTRPGGPETQATSTPSNPPKKGEGKTEERSGKRRRRRRRNGGGGDSSSSPPSSPSPEA